MTETPGPLLAILGPTASGKTDAAIDVARAIGAEIVNVDSTLLYRGMDVATAKPTPEQRAAVPHHLIDVAEPDQHVSVAGFKRLAAEAIEHIRRSGKVPLLVGGSGLYYRAVADDLAFPPTDPRVRRALEIEAEVLDGRALHERLRGVDPEAAERIDPRNVRRTVRALEVAAVTGTPFSSFSAAWERYDAGRLRAIAPDVPRPVLHGRIEARARATWPALVEETRRLLDAGHGRILTTARGIGYAEAVAFVRAETTADEALTATIGRIKALARRQLAWFRRDPRIRWVPVEPAGSLASRMAEHLSPHPAAVAGPR